MSILKMLNATYKVHFACVVCYLVFTSALDVDRLRLDISRDLKKRKKSVTDRHLKQNMG